jgi:hypothetical protein
LTDVIAAAFSAATKTALTSSPPLFANSTTLPARDIHEATNTCPSLFTPARSVFSC